MLDGQMPQRVSHALRWAASGLSDGQERNARPPIKQPNPTAGLPQVRAASLSG